MTYPQLRLLAILLTVLSGMIGLVQTVGPQSLGLPPIVANWLGIVGGGIGIGLGFLPKVMSASEPTPLHPVPPEPPPA